MIEEIHIQNFKSIEDLTLNLGRINVFIGENGCGKSNILEAICMASAANSKKLDNEFLVSRGIRIASPEFTRSAFEKKSANNSIDFSVRKKNCEAKNISIRNDNKPYSKWHVHMDELEEVIKNFLLKASKNELKQVRKMIEQTFGDNYFPNEGVFNQILNGFLIYSPENSSLRTFDIEGQIEPLGVKGEGLFKLLRVLSSQDKLPEIKDKLVCMGWFEDFFIDETNQKAIHVKDRYIDNDLGYFTQNSTNEGFLFILFYLCLFISQDTPNFFAVDNIDASLNPKLCSDLTEILVDLAKKYEKQAIFTTHNAAILDGLNLHDDDQRLFVVSRSRNGRTKIKRVRKPTLENNQDPVKLSVAFTRGYIGGLSRGF